MRGYSVELDASNGGQIFRDALAFSTITGKKVCLKNIRKRRPKPGLKKQHLATLKIMKGLTNAKVRGAYLNSDFVEFDPQKYRGGTYRVNIGSAGSITLLLQSVMLPALKAETKLRIVGGTDVPFSPGYNYLKEILLPSIGKTSKCFSLNLTARGYYPKGEGIIKFESKTGKPGKMKITEKGKLEKIVIYSHTTGNSKSIALNQISAAKKVLYEKLGEETKIDEIIDYKNTCINGNGIDIIARFTKTRLGASALGIKGKSATGTGNEAARKICDEIEKDSAMDKHLLDQLIPFAVVAKGRSEFSCSKITKHAESAMRTAENFFNVSFSIKENKNGFRVTVNGAGYD